jgi:hypothetical protein
MLLREDESAQQRLHFGDLVTVGPQPNTSIGQTKVASVPLRP